MDQSKPSIFLYKKVDSGLQNYNSNNIIVNSYLRELTELMQSPHYPCIPAIKAFNQNHIMIGFYKNFGSGSSWRDIRNDIKFFLEEQAKTESFLSLFIVFDEIFNSSESEFEKRLWNELSFLTSKEDKDLDWDSECCSDPSSKNFSFNLHGEELFVVGMHKNSSRLSRKNTNNFFKIKHISDEACIAFIDTSLSHYRKEKIDFHSILKDNNINNDEDIAKYIYSSISKHLRNPSFTVYEYLATIPECSCILPIITEKIKLFKD